ncbi:hypothetical protein AAG906_003815 [Vitis piasezkii]
MDGNMLSGVGGGLYQDLKEAGTIAGGKILDVKNLERNYKKLITEAEELWTLKDDIEKASRVKIKPPTREWITMVDRLKNRVNGLETEYNEGKRKQWRLDCFWSNANFSEELEKQRQQVLITRIGIWGPVGTGKTTIMKHLNDNEKIASMFEIVIWVSVSKEWSIEKLQEAIMQQLELDAERLNEKECLILLDEVCQTIKLDKVMGIGSNQNHIKVVLASRHRGICINMETVVQIGETIVPPDAWNMFRKKVGDVMSSSLIEPTARLVVQECHGLPLLIDRVAKTFKKKQRDFTLWNDGLESLQRWESERVEGIEEVLERLQVCYEDLKDEEKDCFLHCVLYPEESMIYVDYLIECWRAEGSILHAEEFRKARVRGHTILHELMGVSFLERTAKTKYVTMNKLFRKLAIDILSQKDNKYLAKPCEGLQEFPHPEECNQASKISLMNNRLSTLPETLDCGNLSALFLQRNKDLSVIPRLFFQSMCRLRVLDLQGTGIAFLPSSISMLVFLRGLYLNSCIHLTKVPSEIKALQQLESMDWNNFQSLSNSNTIEASGSITLWETVAKEAIEEIAELNKLTSLRLYFPGVDHLRLFVPKSPVWNSRFAFQFSVGYEDLTHSQIFESLHSPRYNSLKMVNGAGTHLLISDVLEKTQAFGLENHRGVSSLSDFGIKKMNRMLVCLLEGCNEVETIISVGGTMTGVLENLKILYVNNMLRLASICDGFVPIGSLGQLTTLTLVRCPELKKIFSDGMIKQLPQLQHLRVEKCHQIEEIIMESENDGLEANALPRLMTLALLDLQTLKSIWIDNSLNWPSLQKIEISTCSMLKKLPFNMVNATRLRSIKGQNSWWEALEWTDDGAIKQRLEPLCILN